jgi:hypothetical protein
MLPKCSFQPAADRSGAKASVMLGEHYVEDAGSLWGRSLNALFPAIRPPKK